MLFQLPIPKSPEIFEALICDFANHLYTATDFSLYGRKGQQQHGIDILSPKKNIAIQCKLKTLNLRDRSTKIKFVNEIIHDLNLLIDSSLNLDKLIIATTLENDNLIQDQFHNLVRKNFLKFEIEYWSWDKISSEIFLYPIILNRYFPIRIGEIELAKINILSTDIYQKSKDQDLLFIFKNIPETNHLPVFDFSFLNNSDEIVLLNSINCFMSFQPVAHASNPKKSTGILKITEKYEIQLKAGIFGEFELFYLDLIDPIFIKPKSPFRIQLQNYKPIMTEVKIYFEFNFNKTIIKTPTLFFNENIPYNGLNISF